MYDGLNGTITKRQFHILTHSSQFLTAQYIFCIIDMRLIFFIGIKEFYIFNNRENKNRSMSFCKK